MVVFSLSGDLKTTQGKTNYARFSRLLIDGGTTGLREVFDNIHPPQNLSNVLAQPNNKLTLNKLKQIKVINQNQLNILYPKTGTVSSMNFDITLLTVLLRNICNLQPPQTGWGKDPLPTDQSKEADIARIKLYRNKLCHGNTTTLSNADFNHDWNEIADALERLGAKRNDIDKLKTASMDSELEQKYMDDLKVWKNREEEAEDVIQTILKKMDSKEEDKIFCDKHTHDHLSMYCKTCLKPICSPCSALEHRNHKICEIKEAATFLKSVLSKVTPFTKKIEDQNKEDIDDAKQKLTELTKGFDDGLEEIRGSTADQKKKDKCEEKSRKKYNEEKKQKESLVEKLEDKLKENTKTNQYFKHVSYLENDTKFLTEIKLIAAHLGIICKAQNTIHKAFQCFDLECIISKLNMITSRGKPGLKSSTWAKAMRSILLALVSDIAIVLMIIVLNVNLTDQV